VLGLIPDEWVWVVRSAAHAGGVAPLVVPPPTGLTRALDAVVEAWTEDLVRLSHARRRVRRLRSVLDLRSLHDSSAFQRVLHAARSLTSRRGAA
jgi:hypothetical protein